MDSLVDDLRRLGVALGDLMMVHTSMRAVGGRAEALVAALDAAVGPEGTTMVVLGAPACSADDPFDHLISPADPDVGVLPEVFRRTSGTVVNDHPDGRFGARGAHAVSILADSPWNDYYGPGSPLAKLVEHGGKVLRLGADLDTVTLLHHAEYLAPVAEKRRVRRTHHVRTANGVREVVVETLDDSNGIVDHPGEDYFAQIVRAYLVTGRAAEGTVGGARSELLDAVDLVEFGAAWMGANLAGGAHAGS